MGLSGSKPISLDMRLKWKPESSSQSEPSFCCSHHEQTMTDQRMPYAKLIV